MRVETVLALDGQRQLGLVAGQAQRQEQLDPAAVELRHGERVVGGGAAGGLDDSPLKGAAQQQRVALSHQAGWDARKVLLIAQNVVALLKEALQKPALACVGLGVGLKQAVDGLVATRVQAGIEQAAVIVEHQRQVGRPSLVQVTLGQEHRAAKRKRQVVFEDAVAGTPVLGVGEVDQAVVAGLGAKREVVHITAQGAREFHVVSNQFINRRADA